MTGPDEELRARLSAVDPMPPTTTSGPLARLRALEILEQAMETIDEAQRRSAAATPRAGRRRIALLAAAAVLVLAAGVGIALTVTDGDDRAATGSTLTLSAGSGDTMSSCVGFEVAILREMPVAFGGTVSAITAEAVTLDVDRWYNGGGADVVVVALPEGQSSAALDGVDFQNGKRYLVTATGGVVNGCGFSGAATPELEAAYAEAFLG
ncbi:MAG: hypothetical protein WKF47_12360 [Geodermatophilaceae bacterium]